MRSMAYVDLNPIRTKLCKTLEQSAFTSIQERLKAFSRKSEKASQTWLLPMASEKARMMHELSIRQTDYFALVD